MGSPNEPTQAKEQFAISVAQLPKFLEDFAQNAKVLSLDCFDTLLWRTAAQPSDVFYQLQLGPEYTRHGLSAPHRMRAETTLRYNRVIEGLPSEVNLEEIYAHLRNKHNDQTIQSLVQAEIEIEKELCFIFEPIFDLLVAARQARMKTIIVSDTYLNAQQLEGLIAHCAAKMGRPCLIDQVFTSSDYRRSKSEGLLGRVANELKVRPGDIVHLGDNLVADYDGARSVGVRGYHFLQFSSKVEARLLEQANMASTLLPHIRHTHPLLSRWRREWATTEERTPAEVIAKYTLAPICCNFAHWIAKEIAGLRNRGEKPSLAFLLRDGFMASSACRELARIDARLQGVPMANLEISRFVAIASSLTSKTSVINYLHSFATSPAYDEILTQLLFKATEIDSFKKRFPTDQDGLSKFCLEILQPHLIAKIIKRSAAYRERFYQRFRKVVNPEAGETLVLIDLGYEGTIHNYIAPSLKKEFNINLTSLFLLLSDSSHPSDEKRGMISDREYDPRLIKTLIKNISPLEQISANDTPSVRDFSDEGEPQFSDEVVPAWQLQKRLDIQQATMRFLDAAFSKEVPSGTDKEIKDETIILLGHFLLMPSKQELGYFEDGVHDVNLGSNQINRLTSRSKDLAILQRRGLTGVGKIDDIGLAWRLAAVDVGFAKEYVTLIRNSSAYRQQEAHHAVMQVRFITANGNGAGEVNVYRTHDGFMRVVIPVHPAMQGLALMLGDDYSWIQLRGAYLESKNQVFKQCEAAVGALDLTPSVQFDGVKVHPDRILQVENKEGFLLLIPGEHQKAWSSGSMVCEVVFRPLVNR